jgi:hypothetical protein
MAMTGDEQILRDDDGAGAAGMLDGPRRLGPGSTLLGELCGRGPTTPGARAARRKGGRRCPKDTP